MARKCAICGKSAKSGSTISHAHNVTKRKFKPNLQRIRVKVDGKIRRLLVCTQCVRSGKVKKA
ncbi:50S ribosomal protein L28 [candidate division WOR_3 bacterium SM23_60]|uniref:Large ribosomal subunit protein bL28 n=1 Tax=candidate division WOR_3 bacterium SM23_60 TaxID=1703780 RepID=A0A0S8GD37_UNCW3|nr:MAG: 50S ribosomal protein L28 [candidate division WOR_3 bacterium SM23_60]